MQKRGADWNAADDESTKGKRCLLTCISSLDWQSCRSEQLEKPLFLFLFGDFRVGFGGSEVVLDVVDVLLGRFLGEQ